MLSLDKSGHGFRYAQLQAERDEWRIFGEDVEETERCGVDEPVLIARRNQRDRPGHDHPTQQLVSVAWIDVAERDAGHSGFRRRHRAGATGDQAIMLDVAVSREVEDGFLAEHGSVEIAGV